MGESALDSSLKLSCPWTSWTEGFRGFSCKGLQRPMPSVPDSCNSDTKGETRSLESATAAPGASCDTQNTENITLMGDGGCSVRAPRAGVGIGSEEKVFYYSNSYILHPSVYTKLQFITENDEWSRIYANVLDWISEDYGCVGGGARAKRALRWAGG